MQTQILLTITHSKPLPKDAEEVIAQRFYMWSFARGVEVGVTARLLETPHWCSQQDETQDTKVAE